MMSSIEPPVCLQTNIEHTNKMLDAYAKHFTILDKGKARASGGREYYHFKRIDRETDGI